jgi:hypothetical protein
LCPRATLGLCLLYGLGLALAATLLAIWFKISTALSEIVVGTVAQLVIGAFLAHGGLHYTIEPIAIIANGGATIQTTRVVWGAAIQGTARSILSSVEGEETEHYGKKMDEAKNFLYNTLAKGPVAVAQVKAQARTARIASVTLQRAKEAMNIQSAKSKGDFVGGWDWFLPDQAMTVPAELLRQAMR